MAEHHEDEQEAKGQGWHEEEVDGDDVSGMRGEKDPPRGRGSRRSPVHVLGDGQLGDRVAEQGEFRLDAPAPPGGILASHAPDESGEARRRAAGDRPGSAWTSTASKAGSLGGATPERWRAGR